jgi:hypothetical protein
MKMKNFFLTALKQKPQPMVEDMIWFSVLYLSHAVRKSDFKNCNILKFGTLMNQTKQSKIKKLCTFIRYINENVCPPG